MNVQGILGGNTAWTAAQSPIYILGDVQVPAGVTLTINPGVELRFTGAYQILIQGAVRADGTTQAPILFRSTSPGTPSGATAFKFYGADLTLSSLTHVDFADVALALRIGEETEHAQGGKNTGQLPVSFITARSTRILTDGYQTTASLLLEDVDFDDVNVQGAYPRSEPIILRRGHIANSVINPDSYNYGITVESMVVVNTTFSMGCCGASLTLRDSRLQGGILQDYNTYYQVTVERCLLESVPLSLSGASGVSIEDSTLVYQGGNGVIAKNLHFLGSTIRGAETGLLVSGSDNQVSDSSLTANSIALVFDSQASGSVSSSNFTLNSTLNLRNDSANPIHASDNHWGVLTTQAIEDSITHYPDDINRGLVTFSPFLTEPSTSAPLAALRVVQTIGGTNGAREIYWSRGIEAGVHHYRVHVFAGEGDTTPLQSWTVGNVNHHTVTADFAGLHVAVTACKEEWTATDGLANGSESWFTWGIPVAQPDWFELLLQPHLGLSGNINNTANQPVSCRILSWTLPPSAKAGQRVETTVRVEYSDDVSPIGSYDRNQRVSASLFGDWDQQTALMNFVNGESNGAPRVVEYPLNFDAPSTIGTARLRISFIYGSGSTFQFFGEDNLERVGPYADTSLEIVADEAPPLKPTNLQAFAGADSVYLTWTANSEPNLAGYYVYRGTNTSFTSMVRLTSESVTLNEYEDPTSLATGTYFYRIVAVNEAGAESEPSKAASAIVSRIVMTMDDYSGAPGSTVKLVIAAENARGVSGNGFDVSISYDKSLLTPVSVSTTPLTKNFQLTDNVASAAGIIEISGFSTNGASIKGRGGLLAVRFLINPSAAVGTVAEHSFVDAHLYNSDLQALAVDFTDTARFKVSLYHGRGDVNGDGEIDALDALLAGEHAASLRTLRSQPPEFAAADMNKDNLVSAADVVLIQQLAANQAAPAPQEIAPPSPEMDPPAPSDPVAIPAPPHISLSIPSIKAAHGLIITVPVLQSGNLPVSGIDLGLIYDPQMLRLLSIEQGSLTSGFLLQSDLRQGSPNISLANASPLPAEDGEILNLSFEVLGNSGQSCAIRFNRLKLVGEDGHDLAAESTVEAIPGIVTVTGTSTFQLTYASTVNGHLEGLILQNIPPGSDGQPVFAIPDSGYTFASWSDGLIDNPRTDTNLSSDVSVSAHFDPILTAGGVSLVWYWRYGLDPVGDELDFLDTDGDGIDNYREYLTGTDPTDPASRFRVSMFDYDGAGFVHLKWLGGSGDRSIRYEIQYTSNLGSGSWTNLAVIDSSAIQHEWSATKPELANFPRLFFRIIVTSEASP